ncbi:hypothetical protein [Brevundimonas variabilis]|uniref:Uncharacterized protein n=1 Tax=Brevundimonas variabilis TaxID=74312 RepID=A0A7W9FFU1_9CAUL|nr:hypothetical protein [Brevundimonas variabilis]MBB5745724.1 hypothetical protein [Brevundimonas variabilis]
MANPPSVPRLDEALLPVELSCMWGIVLINAAGDMVDSFVLPGPIETIRDGCRRHLEARPDAAQARLVSQDGLLDHVYPECGAD